MKYWETIVNGYTGYANYLWSEILHPGWHNYFYWLIGLSLSFWDYLFKTNDIPRSGKDELMGFDHLNQFPKTFLKQLIYPFFKTNNPHYE